MAPFEELKALRAAVDIGIEDFELGNYVEFADSKSLHAHLDTLAAAARKRVKSA